MGERSEQRGLLGVAGGRFAIAQGRSYGLACARIISPATRCESYRSTTPSPSSINWLFATTLSHLSLSSSCLWAIDRNHERP
ncbi:hypothetical protein IG631_20506 [Alternaria alternata]|nr:hypothetical protein IG631_20506 [Alternaria alternata]